MRCIHSVFLQSLLVISTSNSSYEILWDGFVLELSHHSIMPFIVDVAISTQLGEMNATVALVMVTTLIGDMSNGEMIGWRDIWTMFTNIKNHDAYKMQIVLWLDFYGKSCTALLHITLYVRALSPQFSPYLNDKEQMEQFSLINLVEWIKLHRWGWAVVWLHFLGFYWCVLWRNDTDEGELWSGHMGHMGPGVSLVCIVHSHTFLDQNRMIMHCLQKRSYHAEVCNKISDWWLAIYIFFQQLTCCMLRPHFWFKSKKLNWLLLLYTSKPFWPLWEVWDQCHAWYTSTLFWPLWD